MNNYDIQVYLEEDDLIIFRYDLLNNKLINQENYNKKVKEFNSKHSFDLIVKAIKPYILTDKNSFKIEVTNEVYEVKVLKDNDNKNNVTVILREKLSKEKKNNFLNFNDLHRLKLLSLGEMTSGIIHDIKNPISISLNSIELIKMQIDDIIEENEDSLLNDDLMDIKEKMIFLEEGTSRVNDVIEGITLLSRKEQPSFNKFNLYNFLRKTTSFLKYDLDKSGVSLDLKVNKNLEIIGKESLLAQVITNIVKNAIDAVSNQPFNKKWIEISEEEDKNFFIIKIKDSGEGIPDSLKDKILEPFFTTKEVGKGTGLGLSLSKQILELHNGSLSIDNSKETTFILKICKKL